MPTGVRHTNAAPVVVVNTALTATRATLWTRGTQNAPQRKVIIRKIMAFNSTGGNRQLLIGTAAGDVNTGALTQILPTLQVLNNIDNTWGEGELPSVPFDSNIFADLDAIPAGNVMVTVEVEEY